MRSQETLNSLRPIPLLLQIHVIPSVRPAAPSGNSQGPGLGQVLLILLPTTLRPEVAIALVTQ